MLYCLRKWQGKRKIAPFRPCPKRRRLPFRGSVFFKKENENMKEKLKKLLRLVRIDVLLLGLLEKIVLGLIKRLPDFQNKVLLLIDELRAQPVE